MRGLVFVFAALVIAGSASGHGEKVKAVQLVGFTSATALGDAGVWGMNAMCAAEFEASKMCNSAEVLDTWEIPILPVSTEAWVRPSLINVNTDASWTQPGYSCIGWTRTDPDRDGLVVSELGRFRNLRGCDIPRPVSCCSLLPVPEPSVSLGFGVGAAFLASLGRAGACSG